MKQVRSKVLNIVIIVIISVRVGGERSGGAGRGRENQEITGLKNTIQDISLIHKQ